VLHEVTLQSPFLVTSFKNAVKIHKCNVSLKDIGSNVFV
jgi:hypothetical protein